jgi:hypothetical protein
MDMPYDWGDIKTCAREVAMGLFEEVHCNHELFGVHKGEMHQVKDLQWVGGALEKYEITSSGRLKFLQYRIEERTDPAQAGVDRFLETTVFTGGRRDLNYHG